MNIDKNKGIRTIVFSVIILFFTFPYTLGFSLVLILSPYLITRESATNGDIFALFFSLGVTSLFFLLTFNCCKNIIAAGRLSKYTTALNSKVYTFNALGKELSLKEKTIERDLNILIRKKMLTGLALDYENKRIIDPSIVDSSNFSEITTATTTSIHINYDYKCKYCGASSTVEISNNTTSIDCEYCGSPLTITT